ncbi:MAG: phosphoribosylamine--glycine ligase [Patescibacteria group bacterium]
MRITVFGSDARAHALCTRLTMDTVKPVVTCVPGNAGMKEPIRRKHILPACMDNLARSVEGSCDLAIVGSDRLLAQGLSDKLRERGIPTFGPSKCASEIEWSKLFAKSLMDRYRIPTAKWGATSDEGMARAMVKELGGPPIVLKADGLADGKGVFVADTDIEVDEAITALFTERRFGGSKTVIIEEKLSGCEVSYTALCDGRRIMPLPCAMDYKQALAGDKGPNTGGMGAHSPSFVLTPAQCAWIDVHIMQKVVDALASQGLEYRGALYAGLMVLPGGDIRVIEFNARFGDPECQVLMPRIGEDLAPLLLAAATGNLSPRPVRVMPGAAVCVTLASAPYPEKATPKGFVIDGILAAEKIPGVHLYHAHTTRQGDASYIEAGGRVLSVCANADSFKMALEKAYVAARTITWRDKTMRQDIGWRVLDKYTR